MTTTTAAPWGTPSAPDRLSAMRAAFPIRSRVTTGRGDLGTVTGYVPGVALLAVLLDPTPGIPNGIRYAYPPEALEVTAWGPEFPDVAAASPAYLEAVGE
jgi:hypothetical protein